MLYLYLEECRHYYQKTLLIIDVLGELGHLGNVAQMCLQPRDIASVYGVFKACSVSWSGICYSLLYETI